MKVNITKTILIPMTPNFIRTSDDKTIPIEELSDEQLAEIGKEWTRKLIDRKHQKINRPRD